MPSRSITLPLRWRRGLGLGLILAAAGGALVLRVQMGGPLLGAILALAVAVNWLWTVGSWHHSPVLLLAAAVLDAALLLIAEASINDAGSPLLGFSMLTGVIYLSGIALLAASIESPRKTDAT